MSITPPLEEKSRQPVKASEGSFDTVLGYHAPGKQSRPLWRRRVVWGVVLGGTAILAIALGVGLGVGLHKHKNDTASPGNGNGNSTNATTPISSPAAAQNISYIQRSQLWNETQYNLANSSFEISATPQDRVFNWTISEISATPGGMTKNMVVVNNQSPGPTIHANLGDRVIINVQNNLLNETALHWHGQLQNGTNFMDGTYSITQCGIPPGGLMTYNWTVQTVGTYWWHAHRSEQYTDGLFGALINHSPNETALTTVPYPIENDVILLLNDMYNTEAMALQWRFTALGTGLDGQPGDEPVPDGGMINGVSQANCAYIPASDSTLPERKRSVAPRSTTGGTFYPETNYCENNATEYYNLTLEAGTSYRLRLINSGTFLATRFSIDGHNLTVVEVDGTSIEPMTVSGVNLGVAQRASVIVHLDQTPGAYWMRSDLDMSQATYNPPNTNETTLGVLRYSSVSSSLLPTNVPAPDLPGNLTDLAVDTTLFPADKQNAPLPTTSTTVSFDMQYADNNQHYMFMNGSSWAPLDPGQAAFFEVTAATNQSSSIGSQLNVVSEKIQVMDIILNSLDDGTHPFHLHGHQFWIMSVGDSGFYTDSSRLNATNPMRRDTIVIPAYGHAVIRVITDNPGVWALHCHIGWHMSIGLLMTLTSLPSSIATLDVPQALRDMCSVDSVL